MTCKHCGHSIRPSHSKYNLGYLHEGTQSAYCHLKMAEPEAQDVRAQFE